MTLRRKSPPKRNARLKTVNRKRKAKRFAENFGGEAYLAHIKSLPCAICGVVGFSEAAHIKSRGAGGKAKDLVPLCGQRPVMVHRISHLIIGCHRRFDSYRWLLPPDTEERLAELASQLYADFHATETPKENER